MCVYPRFGLKCVCGCLDQEHPFRGLHFDERQRANGICGASSAKSVLMGLDFFYESGNSDETKLGFRSIDMAWMCEENKSDPQHKVYIREYTLEGFDENCFRKHIRDLAERGEPSDEADWTQKFETETLVNFWIPKTGKYPYAGIDNFTEDFVVHDLKDKYFKHWGGGEPDHLS